MSLHHTKDQLCPLCEDKIKEGHPELSKWWSLIKKQFPDCHISWVYRNKEMQNLFYDMGKTRAKYPNSSHNFMKDGKPYSRAMDLFQMRDNQVAAWPKPYFENIEKFLLSENAPIEWGGHWKSIGDGDHFEIKKDIKV